MKFDPISKIAYTDRNEYIKKLECPYRMNWDALDKADDSKRKCSKCDHFIIDTAVFTDDELLDMVRQNPNTCFKIDLNQQNIKLYANVSFGNK